MLGSIPAERCEEVQVALDYRKPRADAPRLRRARAGMTIDTTDERDRR
jgi:hypothetical protein